MLALPTLAAIVSCGACEQRERARSVSPAANEVLESSGSASNEPFSVAREIFAERCSGCHGTTGRGDGPLVIELWKLPPDFRSSEWQSSASDRRIEQAILEGGKAIGLSRFMPAYPDLASRPAVLVALREYVRGLALAPPR
jgi:mono/diheme cytochrome c family protein